MPDKEQITGFDLNQHILQWRQGLASKGTFSEDRLSELESHLHDSVKHWTGKGLTVEESFWIARSRTGSPEALSAEFAKTEPATVWRNRTFWMVTGLLSSGLLSNSAYFLTNLLACWISPSALLPNANFYVLILISQIGSILFAAFFFITLSRSGWLQQRFSPHWGRKGFILAVFLAALFAGGLPIASEALRIRLMSPQHFHSFSEALQSTMQQRMFIGSFAWPLAMALLSVYLSPFKRKRAARLSIV